MQIQQIKINDLEFDCRVSGDQQNELVILLHGFPETSHMWIELMNTLTSMGLFCVAPNMRGYSKNACPKGVKNYKIKYLVQDIVDIANSFHKDKFHLIGHDWGAVIGWNIVHDYKERIISWTGLSVPHIEAFFKALETDKEQQQKSSYIKLFSLPFIPEMRIRKNDFEKFRNLWKNSTPEEVTDYLSVFRNKKSLTAALNYYRANVGKGKTTPIGNIKIPTLFIWGNKDLAIGGVSVENGHQYMKGDYTYKEVNGGHWLMQTNYTEVTTAITEHISKYKTVLVD